MAVAVTQFADRLADAVERKQSQLVVGLDPDSRVDDVDAFCRRIVDAVEPFAVAVKPQSAFFEARGADGVRAFRDACAYARDAGLIVLADAKRGDIGSTAQAYAEAFYPLADALTVNPYLGGDSLEPYFDACRRYGAGVLILLKTSNPGSADLQDARLEDGRRVWELVAEKIAAWGEPFVGERGLSSVGAVIGATHPREIAEARALLPHTPFLLPGIGVQGGTPEDVAAAFACGPAGGLVSASRSVIYADDPGAEASRLAREAWHVSRQA
ncbi:MAG: orotidine-5'-phosphate decarboxylase [Actinomycetota bacterium]